MEVHSQFDILSFNNEWTTKSTRMFNNLRRVPKRLEKEGIISSEQLSDLLKRNNDIEKLIKTTSSELKEELKDINTEKLEEMKQSIKDKYNKQTSE
ncbi:hypothetical protein JNUCC1_03064 [Lentibacillus sp. JNUCC-1]|nr:hypothetical protein [Lentibacillus sp. JNUCC-1]